MSMHAYISRSFVPKTIFEVSFIGWNVSFLKKSLYNKVHRKEEYLYYIYLVGKN